MERITEFMFGRYRLKPGYELDTLQGAKAAVDRLAAYEDIGPIDHLRELVQAEQDGRLVVLPCKVGDTVYMPDAQKIIIPVRVQGIAITASGQTILHFGGYPVEYAWGNEVGKTIHLTHAEAEAALGAQKGGED